MGTLFPIEDMPISTKNNEWFTPHIYIEAARSVMGGIDLDVASCEIANKTVKAARYYTKEQDGLKQPWQGRIWLNPPFGKVDNKSYIRLFILKLLEEYQLGNVKQAVLLTTVRTDCSWFAPLWNCPICFCDHHVNFYQTGDTPGRPGRTTASHIHGTIFVYLGPNINLFVEHFTDFGPVVTPDGVHKRPQPLQQPTLWDQEA